MALGETHSIRVQTVLFVCVENTFRSVLAEALFNARAPKGWQAESAGARPAATINPVVVDLLREVGIALGPKTPRLASHDVVARATHVVTFGCLDQCPPGTRGKSEDWPLPGATGKSMDGLRGIRDELARRIDRLIDSLPGS